MLSVHQEIYPVGYYYLLLLLSAEQYGLHNIQYLRSNAAYTDCDYRFTVLYDSIILYDSTWGVYYVHIRPLIQHRVKCKTNMSRSLFDCKCDKKLMFIIFLFCLHCFRHFTLRNQFGGISVKLHLDKRTLLLLTVTPRCLRKCTQLGEIANPRRPYEQSGLQLVVYIC